MDFSGLMNRDADDAKFGHHYYDKPNKGIYGQDDDDDQEDDGADGAFDMQACENDCCDLDCECDDCLRCSANGMQTDDGSEFYGAAAA